MHVFRAGKEIVPACSSSSNPPGDLVAGWIFLRLQLNATNRGDHVSGGTFPEAGAGWGWCLRNAT